ncbi:MAG: hypothetical protein QM572_07830 [Nocardioides sp.]|uniref:DUF6907 domain-containing protein n=1 Tax=Nocardioides sp. TaxID=35761 RepID=UPI0039E70B28
MKSPPTWLTEPCPVWCARDHAEDDQPEDRAHRSAGVSVAVIAARPRIGRPEAQPRELVLTRFQHPGDPRSWVALELDGRIATLLLSAESYRALRSVDPLAA